MHQLVQEIIDQPIPSLLVVGNLVIIESLLSVDNAAVLATMVMDLPYKERPKALRYGIFGAYIFRGLCLLFASFLVKIWWLKPIGGLYLLYLVFTWARNKIQKGAEHGHDEIADKKQNGLYKKVVGSLGTFWATVILVEVMDLAFSIDNVFAAIAFSQNIILIWVGVFIGILAMRFVAQGFVALMEKFPFLEACAYIVIGILGAKLSCSLYQHFQPEASFSLFLDSQLADILTSAITIGIFIIPLLVSWVVGRGKRNNTSS